MPVVSHNHNGGKVLVFQRAAAIQFNQGCVSHAQFVKQSLRPLVPAVRGKALRTKLAFRFARRAGTCPSPGLLPTIDPDGLLRVFSGLHRPRSTTCQSAFKAL